MKSLIIPLLILLSLSVLLTACATSKERPLARREVGRSISGRAAIGSHTLAVGGVIADEEMRITTYPGDPAANAETMLVLLQSALRNRRIVAETMLSDLVLPETMASIRSQYARTGSVDPADLQQMGRELVDIERLMMARVETLNAGVNVRDFRLERDRGGEIQVKPLGQDAGQPLAGFRDLRVTLDVWDLGTGGHLWSVRTAVRDRFRGDEGVPAAAAAAAVPGRSREASRRNEALDEALTCLVQAIGRRPERLRITVPAGPTVMEDPLR